MGKCIICGFLIEVGEETVLTKKGCQKINEVSVICGENIVANPKDEVHENCRRGFVSENHINSRLRGLESNRDSNTNEFNIETCCFFCGKKATVHGGRLEKNVTSLIVSDEFMQSVESALAKRSDDDWTQMVASRVRSASVCVGARGLYHTNCRIGFRTNKALPKSKTAAAAVFTYKNGFIDIVNLIRTSQKQYSIKELIDKMNIISGGNGYSFNQMKHNLVQYFGDEIIVSTHQNKKTLVTLQSKCHEILNEHYEADESDIDRAIRKVSDTILYEIKNVAANKSFYPSSTDIALCDAQKFLPEKLHQLLSNIITGHNASLKIVSVGQAIIQSAHRENVLSPLQLALAVQMHYFTGSRFVVNTLNALGFCSTYAEAKKFQSCASVALHSDKMSSNYNIPVIKYVADNVDHNLRTLDGKDTFHGMGIISIHPTIKKTDFKIPRVNVNLQDIKAIGSVEIVPYIQKLTPATSLLYLKLIETAIQDPNSSLDLLWKTSWSKGESIRPGWSGMMQLVQQGEHPGTPTINFLPIIDMDPTDYTCINSTLHFICKDAEKYNASLTATFDNPLYWKARTIIENEPLSSPIKRIVLCLGGFHTKMSFLGTIGHIMAGTGLDVVLGQVYAENSVTHMLTGKAYARAIRGHFLVDSALNSILLEDVLNGELSSQIRDLLKSTLEGRENIDKLDENEVLQKVKLILANKKQILQGDSNSRVWLQYMDMVDLLRSNIRAERTGNFKLVNESLQRMLSFFAASGHNAYTKATHVFLQDMGNLQRDNSTVFDFFNDGNFVTRRTERFWAGLPDDLIIEQLLMRSLKVSGGLTRGRGMDDAKRTSWLYSLPARAELNTALQDLTNLKTETSEQHKECGKSRLIRDNKDIDFIYNFLKERNPFDGTTPNEFRNIADGIVSTSKANVDRADQIGSQILRSLENKNVFEYSFERCKQVVRLSSKNELVVDGEMVIIDPETLFQRLLLLIFQSDRNEDEREAAFAYELCQKAPSLFDQSGLMREANSATLIKTLITKTGNVRKNFVEELPNVFYVLEGDWLINKISWRNGDTFDEICERYVTYVKESFGQACIVFNWNNSPSIYDENWLRKTKGCLGIEVIFNFETELKMKKELFLRNKKNIQRFVSLLSKKLKDNGVTAITSFDNLIVMMAKSAVESSKTYNTVVVGEQADLLMLLCFYALPESCSLVYMYEETSKKPLQVFLISEMKEKLGETKSKRLLFAHAMGGCSTTSQFFNVSKGALLSKLDNDRFAEVAEIFCCPDSSQYSIIDSGKEVIVSLYAGKSNETLNKLRYRKFGEKSQRNSSSIKCQALPPTEAAAKFHCLRVFCTIQMWMENKLNPLNYGWVERNNMLRPVTTNLPSAPSDILSNVRCGCKGDCNSNRCSCYKAGFKCTLACKVCAGNSCSNHSPKEEDSDSDVDE